MSIHYIEDTKLKEITDAVKAVNKMAEDETFSGADMAQLIRDNKLLKLVLNGALDENATLYEVTAEDLKGLTRMRSYTFFDVRWLKKITFPEELTNIGNNNFASCTNLEEVVLSSGLGNTGTAGFSGCAKLTKINTENLKTIGQGGFQKCSVLNNLAFHNLTSIAANGFLTCSTLDTLIIRTDSVCKLASVNAFSDTPIANGTGFVYVPLSLIEDYKTATNWATYAAQLRAIEDYPEICGGVSE